MDAARPWTMTSAVDLVRAHADELVRGLLQIGRRDSGDSETP
jgi:hypothetical protein